MEKEKFEGSPIHDKQDKQAIIAMMDKLTPDQMVKVVDFITQLSAKPEEHRAMGFDAERGMRFVRYKDCAGHEQMVLTSEGIEYVKKYLAANGFVMIDFKSVFFPEDVRSFAEFIRTNYYGVGAPKMMSYHPEKFPNATIDEIFVLWSTKV
jgi:hypothetical protein